MARILVTRPIEEARQTAQALALLGHEPVIEPMLEIVFGGDALPAGRFDALIVTSGNALAALYERPEFHGLTATPLIAVGRRTGAVARAMGFEDVETFGRDVASLISHVRQAWREPHRALYLAGADRTGDLVGALGGMGHRIDLAVVYTAHQAARFRPEIAAALAQGKLDGVLHYSARTAEAFIACTGGAEAVARLPVRHLCLSRKVAEVISATGAAGVVFPARPEEDALLALI
ncbi:uroporphyrinogen-III synthase [Labrys neptuniae]|uniref:uroporphyrinogen-III synthase n=1 Tax=Labrys neptuniae TaxID=376174 RepID=UPI00288DB193|nr:uroporphyrinogen-III synthase [Labrys neptuniae]MDT3379457.1 uroporphyrinogen-III synthase [Labrys neptuniae]